MPKFRDYIEELTEASETISVFDIDDTLLTSDSKIYYTLPGETEEQSVSTGEFAKKREKLPKGTKFDYRDFREFGAIYSGITNGKPNIPVLKKLDKAILAGHKIGILTARGNQSAVLAAIKDKILFKDKSGELQKLPRTQFRKRWVWAISDVKTEKALKALGADGEGAKEPQSLKAFVLQKIIADKEGFSNIIFYDDDQKNIDAVKALNDPRIHTKKI